MAGKYKERDVLKIKKDIEIQSGLLSTTIKKREEEEKELKRLELLTADEKKKIGEIWESTNAGLLIAKTAQKDLQRDCEVLRADKKVLESQVALWGNLLSEVIQKVAKANVKVRDRFLDALVAETKSILTVLLTRKKAEEEMVASLTEERQRLETGIVNLKEQETAFTGKVEMLEADVERETNRVKALQENADELDRREHDIKAMEIRITPEYQAIYFGQNKEQK